MMMLLLLACGIVLLWLSIIIVIFQFFVGVRYVNRDEDETL
jgi:hypothetical protein